MPNLWKATLGILIACLIASMVIGTVKLLSTSEEVFDPPVQGWRGVELPR